MPKTVYTTTISLPKSMAADLQEMTLREGRTVSELIREALRHYQRMHSITRGATVDWQVIRSRLKRISKEGSPVNLAEFIARDRRMH
ncbi:MAG: hypothetical protein UX98_C0015G0023 [Parcubacteria group bacterium GW2011_GWA2_47_26]|nr:MAG: hypothetical protein UX98_C0015G0023 [Parcubacteria group bacterium GW2011_GWA2_47_26]